MATIRKLETSFQLDYYLLGERKRVCFPTKNGATQAKKMVEDQIMMEKLGLINIRPKLTIKEAIHIYYDNVTLKKQTKNTHGIEKDRFTVLYDFLIKKNLEHLGDVTPVHMDELFAKFRDELSPASVNKYFGIYKAFFNHFVNLEYLEKNPVKVKKLKENPAKKKIWGSSDIKLVCESLPDWAKNVFLFLAESGARPIELANLTFGSVDFSRGSITVHCGKNSKEYRELPMTEYMIELVRTEMRKRGNSFKQEDLVFLNSRGNKFTTDNFQKTLKKALNKAEFGEGYVAYGLRHSFADRLVDSNVSTVKIKELMGHTSVRTTEGYLRNNVKGLGQVMQENSLGSKLLINQ